MKKYISAPDFSDETITHYFEVPSAFFVHAKARTDGVAIVIGDTVNDTLYGYTVPAAEDLLPVLEHLVAHDDTAGIEYMVAFFLNAEIRAFLADEKSTVFDIERCRGMLEDELNYNLEDAMLPEMFEGKHKPKRRKKNRKTNQRKK